MGRKFTKYNVFKKNYINIKYKERIVNNIWYLQYYSVLCIIAIIFSMKYSIVPVFSNTIRNTRNEL